MTCFYTSLTVWRKNCCRFKMHFFILRHDFSFSFFVKIIRKKYYMFIGYSLEILRGTIPVLRPISASCPTPIFLLTLIHIYSTNTFMWRTYALRVHQKQITWPIYFFFCSHLFVSKTHRTTKH